MDARGLRVPGFWLNPTAGFWPSQAVMQIDGHDATEKPTFLRVDQAVVLSALLVIATIWSVLDHLWLLWSSHQYVAWWYGHPPINHCFSMTKRYWLWDTHTHPDLCKTIMKPTVNHYNGSWTMLLSIMSQQPRTILTIKHSSAQLTTIVIMNHHWPSSSSYPFTGYHSSPLFAIIKHYFSHTLIIV